MGGPQKKQSRPNGRNAKNPTLQRGIFCWVLGRCPYGQSRDFLDRLLKNIICCVGLRTRSLRRPEGRLSREPFVRLAADVFEQPVKGLCRTDGFRSMSQHRPRRHRYRLLERGTERVRQRRARDNDFTAQRTVPFGSRSKYEHIMRLGRQSLPFCSFNR
jgi:hypothetical protein